MGHNHNSNAIDLNRPLPPLPLTTSLDPRSNMSFDLIDPEGLLASPTLQGYQSLPSGPPKLRRSATSSSFARANEGISTFASVTRTKEGLRKMTQNLLQPFSKEKRPTFEDETELLEPKKKYPQDYSGPDSRMQP